MKRVSETARLPCPVPLPISFPPTAAVQVDCEILRPARIVEQNDLLVDLLTGAEVVILGSVRPSGPAIHANVGPLFSWSASCIHDQVLAAR